VSKYIYHYCAQWQPSVGQTTYIDGVALMSEKIKSMDDYHLFKDQINAPDSAKLSIISLSFLGMEE
jgi:hypothetical protein